MFSVVGDFQNVAGNVVALLFSLVIVLITLNELSLFCSRDYHMSIIYCYLLVYMCM